MGSSRVDWLIPSAITMGDISRLIRFGEGGRGGVETRRGGGGGDSESESSRTMTSGLVSRRKAGREGPAMDCC